MFSTEVLCCDLIREYNVSIGGGCGISHSCEVHVLLQSRQLINVSFTMQTSSRSSSPAPSNGNAIKIVFVAGATGQTGKRMVKELLKQGYEVRAGVRDIAKAKDALPKDDNLELVSFL